MKSTLFIGSSRERTQDVTAIIAHLGELFDCRPWDAGFYDISKATLENLVAKLPEYDFALFIFAPEDTVSIRGTEALTVRDNVLFECGLFMGHLARERVYVFIPRSNLDDKALPAHIATDFAGITVKYYTHDRDFDKLRTNLRVPCSELGQVMTKRGPKEFRHLDATKAFERIRVGLMKALTINNVVFHRWITNDLKSWHVRHTEEWQNGIYVSRIDYKQILLDFYLAAQSTVFSTCLPSYLKVWTTPFGQNLMAAHKAGKAKVTRMFIFDRSQDITPDVRSLLVSHTQQGPLIEGRIFFDEKEDGVTFSPHLSKDFTIIDHGEASGGAVGITTRFEIDHLEAKWIIARHENDDHMTPYVNVARALLNSSIKLEDWLRDNP